jgi:serine-type D-Ala-D-Ala carboxypeptidase/endopeptidase (penicillin-binding protein 4)
VPHLALLFRALLCPARSVIPLGLLVVALPYVFQSDAVFAHPLDRMIESKIEKLRHRYPTLAVGVSVEELALGTPLVSIRSRQPLKPASILKLLTTLVALKKLGPEYRFETRFLQKGEDLIVVGGGDPTLTTELLHMMARSLVARGNGRFRKVFLNASLFPTPIQRVGERAYEAGSSGLPLNFNAVSVVVCPTAVEAEALVNIDPREARFPIRGKVMTTRERGPEVTVEFEADGFHVQGVIPEGEECLVIYRSVPKPVRYFGEVFEGILEREGVKIAQGVEEQSATPAGVLLYTHKSKPLGEILRDLNTYSSNFIAEQILTTLGCSLGASCRRDRGLVDLSRELQLHGILSGEFLLVDGSGLSHENLLSARGITSILRAALLDPKIQIEFLASLPVGGRSGTLRSRVFADDLPIRGKTGSLDGVSSLAGYFESRRGKRYVFAIIQNNVYSREDAHRVEEEIINLVQEEVSR